MVNAEEDHAEIVITTSIPMFALCTIVSPEYIYFIEETESCAEHPSWPSQLPGRQSPVESPPPWLGCRYT